MGKTECSRGRDTKALNFWSRGILARNVFGQNGPEKKILGAIRHRRKTVPRKIQKSPQKKKGSKPRTTENSCPGDPHYFWLKTFTGILSKVRVANRGSSMLKPSSKQGKEGGREPKTPASDSGEDLGFCPEKAQCSRRGEDENEKGSSSCRKKVRKAGRRGTKREELFWGTTRLQSATAGLTDALGKIKIRTHKAGNAKKPSRMAGR